MKAEFSIPARDDGPDPVYVPTPANLRRAAAARRGLLAYADRKGENPDQWDTDTIRDFFQDLLHLLQQTISNPGARKESLPCHEDMEPDEILSECLDRAIRDFPNEFSEEGES